MCTFRGINRNPALKRLPLQLHIMILILFRLDFRRGVYNNSRRTTRANYAKQNMNNASFNLSLNETSWTLLFNIIRTYYSGEYSIIL